VRVKDCARLQNFENIIKTESAFCVIEIVLHVILLRVIVLCILVLRAILRILILNNILVLINIAHLRLFQEII